METRKSAPIFERGLEAGIWHPTALAMGPFAGLQGGAIAGLLTGEIEAQALAHKWGSAISASVWFLRPAHTAPLMTKISPVRRGGRISIMDNTLWIDGQDEPCAMARVTLSVPKPVPIEGFQHQPQLPTDPAMFPIATRAAPHGGPWFMDAMELRLGPTASWFRLGHEVIAGAGPLAQILGPADWAHGINRPVADVVADPNLNLNVHLVRHPRGDWVGVDSQTQWHPETGGGMGGGVLLDVFGVIGRVSMSVVLAPFPNSLS